MAFSSARTVLQALGLLVLSFTALAQTAPTPATPATSTTPAPSATPAVQAAPTPPVAQPTAAVTTASASSVLLSPQLVQGNYKDYLMKRYADNKEARAVVHMFGRKQVGGGLWLGGGAAFMAFLTSQTGTTSTSTGTRTLTISPLGYVIFIGLPAVLGINKLSRFGKGSLFKVFTDYDQTHTFPRFVSARVHQGDYR